MVVVAQAGDRGAPSEHPFSNFLEAIFGAVGADLHHIRAVNFQALKSAVPLFVMVPIPNLFPAWIRWHILNQQVRVYAFPILERFEYEKVLTALRDPVHPKRFENNFLHPLRTTNLGCG